MNIKRFISFATIAWGALFVVAFFFFGLGGKNLAHAQVLVGPTIPTDLSAIVNPSNQVYVSWTPSTETSTPVIGYYLYRNGRIIANTPGYTFYTDNVPAGAYSYTVSAYDGIGNTSQQTTPTPNVFVLSDNEAPTTPTDLVATSASSSVSLSWTASTDNFAVVGYYIFRNNVMINNTTTISGTTYLDSGLPEGNTYTYSVAAYDAVGNISPHTTPVKASTIFDVQAPTPPQGLKALAVSPTEIDLSWKPATDNVQVAGYNLWRDGEQIATLSGASTTYADIGLSPGTAYSYFVYAYDEVGNTSIEGPGASATTLPPDITAPSIPKNFTAIPVSSSQVNLSWSPSTDNVGVAGYYLYDGSALIATTASTTYTDITVATSTTYQYFLSAYDASGNVSPQTSIAVTTLSYTPTFVATTTPSAPSPVTQPSSSPSTPSTPITTPSGGTNDFTTNMYYEFRNASVQALQVFLIAQGYLGPNYGTGFYGSLTQGAVQKFQCAESIVCSGGPSTTGWGSVGPRTRTALNSF